MNIQKRKNEIRLRRRARVRAKIFGTSQRPRLSVYRSLRYIYAQLIDDSAGKTLVFASTKEVESKKKNTKEAASQVGILIAKKAKEKGITTAVFDKSFYKFHGRIKSLADAARENGLLF